MTATDGGSRDGEAGTRFSLTSAGQALGIAWRAAPVSLVLYACVTLVLGLAPVATAVLTKWLLDALQFPGSQGPLPPLTASPLVLVVVMGALGAVLALGAHLSTYLSARIQRGVTLVVQERLYTAVNRLDGIRRFEDPRFLDHLRMAQQAANTAPQEAVRALSGTLQGALTVFGLLGVLVLISPVVAAVTVVAGVPALLVQLSVSRQQNRLMWRISPRFRRQLFYQALILDLAAIKETRLFGTGGFLLGRMRDQTRSINRAEDLLDRRVLVSQGPLALLGALVASGGLVWMIGATLRGDFTIGDVSAFVAAVAGVQTGLGAIVTEFTAGYQAILLLGHYRRVVTVEPDLPADPAPVPIPPLREGIRIQDVWFRYTEEGPWVLRGVSLTIPVGATLGVVGLNGAGKSTLVRLLCRMYDPDRGRILWDGLDIRRFDVGDLRSRISAVFQDYMNYDMSARENIAIGALDSLDDTGAVRRSAHQAGIGEHLESLPHGYETMLSRVFLQGEEGGVEEEGVTLSGGQWQRVAIARALMRSRRDLLFLDEPSSGLDAAAEQSVHERLRRFQTGATTILISHRMGAVRHADEIVVLEDGQVTETGTHDRLMELGGEYHRLFSLQASTYTGAPAVRAEG
ncbi:ABC transporter ATP-binding protein [Nocardiopsis sp. NPDC058789]|uniref:ABC transporter ATP-binding protein n=1 Tax=Nocardiopsis sp. NPDC058789 TaxID=3346634 RepID=UPI00366A6F54